MLGRVIGQLYREKFIILKKSDVRQSGMLAGDYCTGIIEVIKSYSKQTHMYHISSYILYTLL